MFKGYALTNYVLIPFGNGLGLLLFCLAILLTRFGFAFGGYPFWSGTLNLASGASVAVIDLWWRKGQEYPTQVERWLSLHEGGAICVIPAWLAGIAWFGCVLYLILSGHLHFPA